MAESAALTAGQLVDRLRGLTSGERQQLSAVLAERGRAGMETGPAAVPRAPGELAPASPTQERLWLSDQLLPGSSAYVVSLGLRFAGRLDQAALRRALDQVTERHCVLRAALVWHDDALHQRIEPVSVPIEHHDVTAETDREAAADEILSQHGGRPFDLSAAPLMRVVLIRLSASDHLLGIFAHHAITDGWSNGILLSELTQIYASLRDGRDLELDPVLGFPDVVAWQRARLDDQRLGSLRGYWRAQLHGLDELLPLPTDWPRAAHRTPRSGELRLRLPDQLGRAIAEAATRSRTTPFAVLLAGLGMVLGQWSGSVRIPVGSPFSGRTHQDTDSVIGPFVNTVVLRLDLDDDPQFGTLVRRASATAAAAQDQVDLPFDKVVEELAPRRSLAFNPVFQVNFGLTSDAMEPVDGITAYRVPPGRAAMAKFDLSVYVHQAPDGWTVKIEYAADLFAAESVERFGAGLVGLLEAGCSNPALRLSALPSAWPPVRPRAAAGTATIERGPDRRIEPVDLWEWRITQIWAQVLDRATVTPADNFFEIGGHSMAGLLCSMLIREQTGRELPLAWLFENPTPELLAGLMRADEVTHGGQPLVVPMRPRGEGPPLILAHSAAGELSQYFDLVRALAGTRPVYGLQADGLVGSARSLSLDEVAASYASALAERFGPVPVHVAGFSAAGRVAVATAQALRCRGCDPLTTQVIDTAPLTDVGANPSLATILSRWLPFAPPRAELHGLGRAGQLRIVRQAGIASGDLPASMSVAQFDWYCQRLELVGRALSGYRPAYGGWLTVLPRKGRDRDLAAEWAALGIAVGQVRPVVARSHLALIGEQAGNLAAELEFVMEAAESIGRRRRGEPSAVGQPGAGG